MTTEPRAPALGDLRVLDCSRLIAGGVHATVLADLGADVIKVENPRGGDPLRTWSRSLGELWWCQSLTPLQAVVGAGAPEAGEEGDVGGDDDRDQEGGEEAEGKLQQRAQ